MDFKEGKHNILVSTSIGEEGLDIGEVDFVIIYDMPKQSIKLVSYSLPSFLIESEISKLIMCSSNE